MIQFLDNIIVDLLDEMMPSKYKPLFEVLDGVQSKKALLGAKNHANV